MSERIVPMQRPDPNFKPHKRIYTVTRPTGLELYSDYHFAEFLHTNRYDSTCRCHLCYIWRGREL